jgi:hypothetical protein
MDEDTSIKRRLSAILAADIAGYSRLMGQDEAHTLGGVQPGRHGDQFVFPQADELCIRAADRHRGDDLARFDSGDAAPESIHDAHQIPARRERQPRRLGVNALAHHDVGKGDAGGEHSDPRFTGLRLGSRDIFVLQDLRAAAIMHSNCFHVCGPRFPNRR